MTAHIPQLSVPLDRQAAEERRAATRKRSVIAAVVLVAVAVGLTVAGLLGSNHSGGGRSGLGDKVSHWEGAHLRIAYPRAWNVTTRPLTAITQPAQRFAIYSGRRPRPMAAPRRNQVIGLVMEQTALAPGDLQKDFPRRPTYFALGPTRSVEGFSGSWAEIVFRDHSRAFYLFVGIGVHAQSQLSRLLASLDTLRVGA